MADACNPSPCYNDLDVCVTIATGYMCVSMLCKSASTKLDYVGTVAVTKSGYPCQRWDSNSPQFHIYKAVSMFTFASTLSDAVNYCRNPDGFDKPWCYTTDLAMRWEACDIPVCQAPSVPWGCSVATADRRPCGPTSMSQIRCEEYGCCYDTTTATCYHSSSNVAGFVRSKGDCIGDSTSPVTATLQECANMCLLDINCSSFTYHPTLTSNNCWVSPLSCNEMVTAYEEVKYNFLKVAVEGFTCEYGDCPAGTLYSGLEAVGPCTAGCSLSGCIGVSIHRRSPGGPHCVRKGAACKFKTSVASLQTARTDSLICYKGETIMRSNNKVFLSNSLAQTLTDNNTATCLSASSYGATTPFLRVRFPWPAMPRSTLNFYSVVHGTPNLKCTSFWLLVPQDKTKPVLLGGEDDSSFQKCQLLGENMTGAGRACSFLCECEVNVCPSVHLFVPDRNTLFCEVQFSASPPTN